MEEKKPAFIVRIIDELKELHKKRTKLEDFIDTEAFSSFNKIQRGLLNVQAGAMLAYEQILSLRLDDLGVKDAD